MRLRTRGRFLIFAPAALMAAHSVTVPAADTNLTLTAVPGIRVGHDTLTGRPTGCTVILTGSGVVAGVDVRGAAPGTRETDLLNPVSSVQLVHAIVLAGGSAFGLDVASGVMRYLDEQNIGLKVAGSGINVPIVPAAILIDLQVGGNPKIRPTAECGYRAAHAATTAAVAEGNVGAGAGATIGKSAGFGRAMKGGLGSAAIVMSDGLIVSAIVAVNAFGDVIDPATGRVVARHGLCAGNRRVARTCGRDPDRRTGRRRDGRCHSPGRPPRCEHPGLPGDCRLAAVICPPAGRDEDYSRRDTPNPCGCLIPPDPIVSASKSQPTSVPSVAARR
jgi:L-aminopeptidase/D-esterase-like protein